MRDFEELKDKEFKVSREASVTLIRLLFKNPKLLLGLITVLLIIFLFSEAYKSTFREIVNPEVVTAGISEENPVKGKIVYFRRKGDMIVKKIKSPNGTPVKAVAGGTVVYAGFHRKLGKTVILKHKYGYYTIYGYLEKINVVEGIYIRRGYIVGYSGSVPVYYEKRKYLYPLNW